MCSTVVHGNMAASLKIFMALMLASVVKDDGAHSCSLRAHKTPSGGPSPCPSGADPIDAAAAPCAWPARGPQHHHGQPGEAAADASIPSNWPGSDPVPPHRAPPAAVPEPEPSGTDYGRLLASLLLLHGYTTVPSRPADSARLSRQQIEQLLTVLLTGPVAVPSPVTAAPAAAPATVPADVPSPPPPQTAPVGASAASPPVDAVPIDTTPATVPESPATVPGSPSSVAAPAAPNTPPDAAAAVVPSLPTAPPDAATAADAPSLPTAPPASA